MRKLNCYLLSIAAALLLYTSTAQAGQLMICKLYTEASGNEPVTTVGWLMYVGTGEIGTVQQIKSSMRTFPQYDSKGLLIEKEKQFVLMGRGKVRLFNGVYVSKIKFYSNEENRMLEVELTINRDDEETGWRYCLCKGCISLIDLPVLCP